MNGELAQMITLATHGTAWLRDPSSGVPAVFPFVRSMTFVQEQRGLLRRSIRSTSVEAWLEQLRQSGVDRVWLTVNDGRWELVTGSLPGPAYRWEAEWEVAAPRPDDDRIWDVRYRGTLDHPAAPAAWPSVTAAGAALGNALTDARIFAATKELEPWPGVFAAALAALETDAAGTDLLPAAYPPPARRLVAAAAASWVFGGMGSWNDLGFDAAEDQTRYDAVSNALYGAVLTSFVAAVNVDL